MAPTPGFWREVRAQATAGTLVVVTGAILGGIVFLVHTVPTQLSRILENQAELADRVAPLERNDRVQDNRLTRLEARP
jgi:hypothetical protein